MEIMHYKTSTSAIKKTVNGGVAFLYAAEWELKDWSDEKIELLNK